MIYQPAFMAFAEVFAIFTKPYVSSWCKKGKNSAI